jgi:hypothetical protein
MKHRDLRWSRLRFLGLFRDTPGWRVPRRVGLITGDNAGNLMRGLVEHREPEQGVVPGLALERRNALYVLVGRVYLSAN